MIIYTIERDNFPYVFESFWNLIILFICKFALYNEKLYNLINNIELLFFICAHNI